jgi:transposase
MPEPAGSTPGARQRAAPPARTCNRARCADDNLQPKLWPGAAGYQAAPAWMRGHGELVKVGVEGTGSYGAGLARYLAAEGSR